MNLFNAATCTLLQTLQYLKLTSNIVGYTKTTTLQQGTFNNKTPADIETVQLPYFLTIAIRKHLQMTVSEKLYLPYLQSISQNSALAYN